jgi:hypothetical protein
LTIFVASEDNFLACRVLRGDLLFADVRNSAGHGLPSNAKAVVHVDGGIVTEKPIYLLTSARRPALSVQRRIKGVAGWANPSSLGVRVEIHFNYVSVIAFSV